MSKKGSKNGAFGYANPPKSSRFKPGQSGNPKGRPPKSKNRNTALKDLLFEVVSATRGRRRERLTRLEIVILAAAKKATEGNTRAFRNFTQWADYCESARPKPRQASGLHIGSNLLPCRSDFPDELDNYWKFYFEEFDKIEAAEAANSRESQALE
jgi:hypothetical protein